MERREGTSGADRDTERSRSALAPLLDDLATRGGRTALLHLQQDESIVSLRYEDLGREVASAARGILRQGVGRGESVALLAGNGVRWVVACLALVRAGAVPVPLDTQLDDETLERILRDCDARVALTDRRNEARVAAVAGDRTVVVLDADEADEAEDAHAADEGDHETTRWAAWIAKGSGADSGDDASAGADTGDDVALPDLDGDDRAVLFYTSGTTGPPKGVPLAHRHVAFQIDAVREADLVDADDRVLLPLPLHHVYPLVVGLLCPLSLGLPVVFPRSLTGPALLRALDVGEATIVIGVPRIYEALLRGIEQRIGGRGRVIGAALEQLVTAATWATRRLRVPVGRVLFAPLRRRLGPRLRVLASGGSALPPSVGFRLEGLGFQVASGYGLTETSPLLTVNPPGSGRLESVGRPIRGVEIRIDRAAHPAKDERPEADVGEERDGAHEPDEGEILARGPGVFDGYLNLEEKTRESFTEDGWLRTGDLGFFDDAGLLHVTGRKSTLLVTSAGEKIRTEEVEKSYAEHAFIDEIGILEQEGGLAAVVVPARDAIRKRDRDIEEAVAEALDERAATLPSHQRIDDFVTTRTALERTRLGKVRRHRLRERYDELREKGGEAEPSEPITLDEMSGEDRELLQDDAAREVWTLLSERFPDHGLTPDASPRLDLGVDSLGWLDLTVEIAQRTGVELDEERIAGIETVRDLLRAVAEAKPQDRADGKAPLEDPHAVLDDRQERWLAPLPRPAALAARGLSALNRGIMRTVFRLDVDGIEHVEHLQEGDRAFVIAPNHASYLDPLAVAAALPEPVRERTYWGGWTGVAFRNALLRGTSRLARAVPVDPERGVNSSLAFAAATLEQGDGLVWFPEGQRSADGDLQAFRPGIGMLLDAFDDVPVVPVHITGSHDAWPPDRRLPRPGRLRVRFGRPCKASDLAERGEGEEARDRIASGLRAVVRELASDGA